MGSNCSAIRKLAAVAIAAVFLSACGKDAVTGGQDSAKVPPSNWDSFVWDQGSWG